MVEITWIPTAESKEGHFPQDGLAADQMREKQRLLYVSMTRAKKKLQLSSARTREGRFSYRAALYSGERDVLDSSPFLKWLPKEHAEFTEKWPYRIGRCRKVGGGTEWSFCFCIRL